MGEVDPAFIQDPENGPKLSIIEVDSIPLIDLSPINSPDNISDPKAFEGFIREICNACKDSGFFQVINHGVRLDKLQKTEAVARKFFDLPSEEKGKIWKDGKSVLGCYVTEHTKNVRDWKEEFDFTVDLKTTKREEWTNQWPEQLPELT